MNLVSKSKVDELYQLKDGSYRRVYYRNSFDEVTVTYLSPTKFRGARYTIETSGSRHIADRSNNPWLSLGFRMLSTRDLKTGRFIKVRH